MSARVALAIVLATKIVPVMELVDQIESVSVILAGQVLTVTTQIAQVLPTAMGAVHATVVTWTLNLHICVPHARFVLRAPKDGWEKLAILFALMEIS